MGLETESAQDGSGAGSGRARRFSAWAARVNLERKAAIALLLGVVASGTTTFAAMTGHFPVVVDAWALCAKK